MPAGSNLGRPDEPPVSAGVPPHAPGSGALRLPDLPPREEVQHRRRWWLKAPPGATREDAMHPAFWTPVARWLSRHDVIALLAHDEAWELELRVEAVRQAGVEVSVSKNYARVPIDLAGTVVADEFHTEYRAAEGWCVVRNLDGIAVVRGHTLEGSAIAQFHRDARKVV